jgi:hypothetical protein
LDSVRRVSYKIKQIINLQGFESYILLPSSGKKGPDSGLRLAQSGGRTWAIGFSPLTVPHPPLLKIEAESNFKNFVTFYIFYLFTR